MTSSLVVDLCDVVADIVAGVLDGFVEFVTVLSVDGRVVTTGSGTTTDGPVAADDSDGVVVTIGCTLLSVAVTAVFEFVSSRFTFISFFTRIRASLYVSPLLADIFNASAASLYLGQPL